MKLRVKEEYKEWSFGGGRMGKIILANLDPSLYQYYYENGYSEFFEEIKDTKKEEFKKEVKENDINK